MEFSIESKPEKIDLKFEYISYLFLKEMNKNAKLSEAKKISPVNKPEII